MPFSSAHRLHSVLRTLRKLFMVDPADYMLSLCGNDALRELSSPGKSGSFFYLTNDDKYMIKTMKKAEVKVSSTLIFPCLKFLRNHDTFLQIWPCFICVQVLLRLLPSYYNHFRDYKNTLLTKYYGLHCVKLNGPIQKKVHS